MNVRFLLDHDVTDGHLKNGSAHAQKINTSQRVVGSLEKSPVIASHCDASLNKKKET
jgi:hypothetical protein